MIILCFIFYYIFGINHWYLKNWDDDDNNSKNNRRKREREREGKKEKAERNRFVTISKSRLILNHANDYATHMNEYVYHSIRGQITRFKRKDSLLFVDSHHQ